MKINYYDNTVEKLCLDYKEANKKLGTRVAIKLHSTIEFILAAECLLDIRNFNTFRLHKLKGNDREGQYAIDLGKKIGYRLIIIPLDKDDKRWKTKDENIIFRSTKSIIMLEVTNHYE